jgi:hypothetical protein
MPIKRGWARRKEGNLPNNILGGHMLRNNESSQPSSGEQ